VQGVGLIPLALVTVLLVMALLMVGGFSSALFMLRRARWLLLPLVLIYAYATPGLPLFPVLGAISPSSDGLHGGILQAGRLVALLLGLSLLLWSSPRESLLSGIYVLLRPFRFMGLDPDRVAVRLWLTLHYAQGQSRQKMQDWRSELLAALDPAPAMATEVKLEWFAFSWRDTLVLALAAFVSGLLLWPGWVA
jgi:energy-coupling factor transporter transmembrane protein EcfT